MLFRIGKVKVSTAVLASEISVTDLISSFARYIKGDWGDVGCNGELTNDLAIANGARIVARYTATTGQSFCLTTDAGVTSILLPHEIRTKPESVAL